MNNIYTLKETAAILKTSVKSTQALIDSGKLNAFKLGLQWRVTDSCIEEYVKAMLTSNKTKKKVIADKPKAVIGNDVPLVASDIPINMLEKAIAQNEQVTGEQVQELGINLFATTIEPSADHE